ncbi:MAG: 3-deoxy-manno-octulosonate cytidylyltransferase [Candidatus Eisenbacteria bacterium]|uniref:3-deoxy-manno-octulosonate cytidylyltransferase n=1 Tax=Eiseniibacteriota bacterium TaxID=2212470 RepID=A0A948RS19_UNCEI|nr:3-deoxy-manno-octulosonate cytidylyltransferase [Candidatus Eisenbacteria bacterium]MBU1947934.1 3-deoxy-manno-octulosonate cytidylyltransferase [Candidatus Eisenbacteria bacterium]MBU2689820.1 3-deoxy-manno-octulosonate cytidylyltransferase [Candidatus Eisenbacteria bacterium]
MSLTKQRVIGVIPARFASTRFPGKVLARWKGRTILEHVYRRAASVAELDDLWIAVDDDRVFDEACSIGAQVCRTSPAHASGTDRVGEVVEGCRPLPDAVLNIQADEPLVDPASLSLLASALRETPVEMVTLAHPMKDVEEWRNPSVVKVVLDAEGNALYFSRAPIPYDRAGWNETVAVYRHVGLYGFRREALRSFVQAQPSPLERAEGLEQLRALEMGWKIRVLIGSWKSIAVDTPEDLAALDRHGSQHGRGGGSGSIDA